MAQDTRERMLEAAAKLLHARGYRGISLNDILEESGAPRGSLYYHFPQGKDELVRDAMLREVERIDEFLLGAFAESSHPAEGVRAYVEAAAEELGSSDYTLGCPVAPVILDSPEASSDLAEACRKSMDHWLTIIRDRLAAAGLSTARAESLAVLIVSSVEGGLLLARTNRETSSLGALADELATIVTEALPAPSS